MNAELRALSGLTPRQLALAHRHPSGLTIAED